MKHLKKMSSVALKREHLKKMSSVALKREHLLSNLEDQGQYSSGCVDALLRTHCSSARAS